MDEIKMKKLAASYTKASDKKAKKMLSKATDEEEYLVCALLYETKDRSYDPDINIAAMATRKIKNKDFLYTIATQSRDMNARLEVVKHSTDEDLLKAICAYRGDTEYIMTNTQAWARDRLAELDEEKAENITDDNELAKMVLGADPSPAHEEIMYRISSADCLIHIAAEAVQWYIRSKAYERLSYDFTLSPEQQNALAEAMIKEKSTNVEDRIYPHEINDDTILRRIASNAKLAKVRTAAICAMDAADEVFIKDLLASRNEMNFSGNEYNDFLKAIVAKVETPELMFEFVKDKKLDRSFRLDCLQKMLEAQAGSSTLDICDEAVKILIDDDRTNDGICAVCRVVPERFHKKYGFTTRFEEYSSEDQYGRYTSSHMYVHFEGKEYRAY